MKLISAAVVVSAGFALAAPAPKGLPKGEAADKFARVEAIAYMDKASVAEVVGGALDEGVLVIAVKVTPADGKKLSISRDDFLLRSDRSGERSNPFTPSQLAGSSTMRVTTQSLGSGAYTQSRGPVWGGMGGGRGGTMPGMGPQTMGNGTAQATEAVASIDEATGKERANPMLAVLKEKILPEKETTEPVEGQLYFLMEGKQKVKDIELLYKTEAGRLSIRFKQQPQ